MWYPAHIFSAPLLFRFQELRNMRGNLTSQRADLTYKIMLANHMKGQQFWLPHNMDFRGRAYVMPPVC